MLDGFAYILPEKLIAENGQCVKETVRSAHSKMKDSIRYPMLKDALSDDNVYLKQIAKDKKSLSVDDLQALLKMPNEDEGVDADQSERMTAWLVCADSFLPFLFGGQLYMDLQCVDDVSIQNRNFKQVNLYRDK